MRTPKKSDIAVKMTFNRLTIHVYGLLHLAVNGEIIGIQSWRESTGKYCIEYTTSAAEFLTEYDSRDMWKAILVALGTSAG